MVWLTSLVGSVVFVILLSASTVKVVVLPRGDRF
jgi:hypothetical protein